VSVCLREKTGKIRHQIIIIVTIIRPIAYAIWRLTSAIEEKLRDTRFCLFEGKFYSIIGMMTVDNK